MTTPPLGYLVSIPAQHILVIKDLIAEHEDATSQCINTMRSRQERQNDQALLTMLRERLDALRTLRAQLAIQAFRAQHDRDPDTSAYPPAVPETGDTKQPPYCHCPHPQYHHDSGLTSCEYGPTCRNCHRRRNPDAPTHSRTYRRGVIL